MTISVTQEHINESKRLLGTKVGFFHDRFQDPVTLAIQEAFKTKRVISHSHTAEIDGVFYSISNEATQFCYKWSLAEDCKPFTFSLEKYVSQRITS